MVDGGERRGMIVFGGLVLLVLIGAILALQITGSMGIEERFARAVGLQQHDDGGDTGGFFGFQLEGSTLAYLVILTLLIIVSIVAYRRGGF